MFFRFRFFRFRFFFSYFSFFFVYVYVFRFKVDRFSGLFEVSNGGSAFVLGLISVTVSGMVMISVSVSVMNSVSTSVVVFCFVFQLSVFRFRSSVSLPVSGFVFVAGLVSGFVFDSFSVRFQLRFQFGLGGRGVQQKCIEEGERWGGQGGGFSSAMRVCFNFFGDGGTRCFRRAVTPENERNGLRNIKEANFLSLFVRFFVYYFSFFFGVFVFVFRFSFFFFVFS